MKKSSLPHQKLPETIEDQATYTGALEAPSMDVGAVKSPTVSGLRANRSPLAWGMSEFVTGPFFLLISHSYTFLVPDSISSTADIKDLFQRFVKRTIDIALSLVGIVLASPIFLFLPILIRLDSRGPAFYTQVRVGQNRRKGPRRAYNLRIDGERRRRDRRRDELLGRPFKVIKFRTMVSDAERSTGPVWASKNDPRVTRLGRFLRKSRLDEVPQLLCVLKGEMSLVGPRPERPVFVKQLVEQVPGYRRRLSVRPGITGLAQVENGYDSCVNSVAEKIRTDLRYIDNWSVIADIKILFRTVWVVFTGRGAQ